MAVFLFCRVGGDLCPCFLIGCLPVTTFYPAWATYLYRIAGLLADYYLLGAVAFERHRQMPGLPELNFLNFANVESHA